MEPNTHDDIFLEAMKNAEKDNQEQDGGPVKKGTVVQIGETDVFLDMGSKAEALVSLDEFETPPQKGDEVLVVIKNVKDGIARASKRGAEKMAALQRLREAYNENLPVRGTIKSLVKKDDNPKGYLVDMGGGQEAFLPLSHIDTRKVEDLEEHIGKSLDLAVIDSRRGQNFTVSRREYNRKTRKKLFAAFFEAHEVGDVIHGEIEEIDPNFVILNTEGIKAFLHVSDFSWKFLTDLRKIVKLGDEMDVQIIQLDKSRDSVKVSKKALMDDPWEGIDDRFQSGDVVNATVVRFRKDGAMVEVEDGIEAFLHVSEMSWTQKVRDPKRLLKRGNIVEVKVKSVEPERRRMEVSLREMQDNPWEAAEQRYPKGKKLAGKVTSILDFGVFIKFDDGIEGLLRREDVDWMNPDVDLKQQFKKGDEIEVVVLSVDPRREKLGLGIKQMSENPVRNFLQNYPKGSPVTATISKVMENGVMVGLQDNLEGFIHISNLSKENIENPADHFSEGDEISATVKFVDVNKAKIELNRKDYLYREDKLEQQKYIVRETQTSEHSISMGSMLKDQLSGFDVSDKTEQKEKKEKKVKKKKTESKKNDEKMNEDGPKKKKSAKKQELSDEQAIEDAVKEATEEAVQELKDEADGELEQKAIDEAVKEVTEEAIEEAKQDNTEETEKTEDEDETEKDNG